MNPSGDVIFVLPSARIGGGTQEAIRLCADLRMRGVDSRVLALWKHPTALGLLESELFASVPITTLSRLTPRRRFAIPHMFLLMVLFLIYVWRAGIWRRGAKVKLVTTHYSTLPFGWFAPRLRRYCFLQDEEWLFVPDGMTRRILRSFILFCCASSRVVTSNEYISARISSAGIHPEAEARIWASSLFESKEVSRDRSIDIAMLLRHGSIKRLDLYLQLLHSAGKKGRQFAVITCEDDIAETASKSAAVCLLRPSDEEMKTLYERSKLFVLLSDREGFGLPPLEAMGSGCVPVCRDSGGIRCYMKGPLKENVIPLDSPVEIVWERLDSLLADPRHLSDLSDMARTIFAEGARAAVEARSVALTLLSS